MKGGVLAHFGVHSNLSFVILDDAVGHGQSESCPQVAALRGEEGIVDALQVDVGDPDTVVGDGNADILDARDVLGSRTSPLSLYLHVSCFFFHPLD